MTYLYKAIPMAAIPIGDLQVWSALCCEKGFRKGVELPSMAFTKLLAEISDESSEYAHYALMFLWAF